MSDGKEPGASAQSCLQVRREGGLLWLTINRPAKHNALSRGVLTELGTAMGQAAAQDDLLGVLLRGAGGEYFAAGGDLQDLRSIRTAAGTEAMVIEARGILDAIRECPVPVIALVNGDALGGGAELAVACDMRIMATHARIGYMHGRLCVSPGWGGGTDLFDLVGRSRALRMLVRAEMVGAADALAWGLADAVAPAGENLGAFAMHFLEPMLKQSPRLLRNFKVQALARRRGLGHDERREIERRQFVPAWTHDDHWAAVERILAGERPERKRD
jgi:enoyl-CoA hydratase/carnithine racemase